MDIIKFQLKKQVQLILLSSFLGWDFFSFLRYSINGLGVKAFIENLSLITLEENFFNI